MTKSRTRTKIPSNQGLLFADPDPSPAPLDTKGLSPKRAAELIQRRRLQCLVHRYLYYVLSEPLITDARYDHFERELKHLVKQFPEVERKVTYSDSCPSRSVGSSNPEDYTRQIEQIALSLLAYSKREAR